MNLKSRIALNTGVQVISKILATILGLLALGIMTRYLGQAGYGEYTTIITFISFFAIIADLGLTLVTVQIISLPGLDENKVINNLFTLRILTALFFLSLGPIAVIFFPYNSVIKIGVLIASLSFVFVALNQVLVGLFQKKLRMDKVSIAEVSSRLVLLLGIILVAKYSWGINGIMWATVFSTLVSFIIHWFFARSFVKIRWEYDKKLWREIIKRSWPLAIIIIFNLIYLKTDTLILSLVKSKEEVGLYGSAYKVIDVLITIPFMFAGIVLPILTSNWWEKNKKVFFSVLQKSFDFMAIVALPLAIGTQFIGDEIMLLVAGPEFIQAGFILRLLIFAASAIFLGIMFSHAIIAVDKQKKLIGLYIFTSITALIGYLIFIPKFSYVGAATVTIYSESLIALVSIYYTWRFTKFLPKLGVLFKSLFASGVMALALHFLPLNRYQGAPHLILTLCLAILVYFVSLYIIKGISRQEIKEILNK